MVLKRQIRQGKTNWFQNIPDKALPCQLARYKLNKMESHTESAHISTRDRQ